MTWNLSYIIVHIRIRPTDLLLLLSTINKVSDVDCCYFTCVMLSVTSPAGCRCHWLSVSRGRCHWALVPGILSDPAPECCWAESSCACAKWSSTLVQREGVLSQPVRARPDRKRAAKYNLKCWHDSNSGKLQGAQWETGTSSTQLHQCDLGERREGTNMVIGDTWP